VVHPLVQQQLEAVRALCRQRRVQRLDLFGSAARDDFDLATSDLDFLVEFERMPPVDHAKCFFGLLDDLKQLFSRRVDLVEPGPIRNPYLRESIERSREALYEAA
jgi:uncharacterized protein